MLDSKDSYDYFHKDKIPEEFPEDWEPMDHYIPDPESPMGKCLEKVYNDMMKVMGITTKVQAVCILKGAVICGVLTACTEGVAIGPCMSAVMQRCGVVANVPRIPVLVNWLNQRAECLKLEGTYIKVD